MHCVNNALFLVSALTTRLAAAETNIKDLTDSLYRTCNTIDTIGASLSGKEQDCCLTGSSAAAHGDRDGLWCFSRGVATILKVDTAATCPVCPASAIGP